MFFKTSERYNHESQYIEEYAEHKFTFIEAYRLTK